MTLEELAKRCIVDLVNMIGPGFHPDDPAAEYVIAGKPVFTTEEAAKIDALVEFTFSVLGDQVYETGLEAQQNLRRGQVQQ